MIKGPTHILSQGFGLLAQMGKEHRYGPLWVPFSETEAPECLNYVMRKLPVWEIEKNVFFPPGVKKTYFMAALPFVSFDQMHAYLYVLGSFNSEAELDIIRNVLGTLSYYLFTAAETTKSLFRILINETEKASLKKHLISSDLLGDKLLNLAQDSGLEDFEYIDSLRKAFLKYPGQEEADLIFDFEGMGWYERYFSYSFTEDIYHIALKTVEKILRNLPVDPRVIDDLIKTHRLFYSFQEHARISVLNYRDHLLHQFQVFLMGFKILSSKWWQSTIRDHRDGKTDGTAWAIVALFHDIGYPFEKIEQIKLNYIKTLLSLSADHHESDMVSQRILLGKLNGDKQTKELLELLYDMLKLAFDKMGGGEQKENLYWFFKKRFIEDRNHAVTSALYVHYNILDKITTVTDFPKGDILAAILLHDKKIWMDSLKSDRSSLSLESLRRLAFELPSSSNSDLYMFKQLTAYDRINSAKDLDELINIMLTVLGEWCNSSEDDSQSIDHSKHRNKDIKYLFGVVERHYQVSRSEIRSFLSPDNIGYKILFVLHRIFNHEPLLAKHSIVWHSKVNPKVKPYQFLLLLCDTLQERGREVQGGDGSTNECYPDIIIGNEPSGEGLLIKLKKSNYCLDDEEYEKELFKLYVDLKLLEYTFDGVNYNVKYVAELDGGPFISMSITNSEVKY